MVKARRDNRLIDAKQHHELEERLAASGVDFWIERSPVGSDPADKILGVARAQRAELIVIGMRKRSPVGKFISGNFSSELVMEGRLGADLMPQLGSIDAKGLLRTAQARIASFKPLCEPL